MANATSVGGNDAKTLMQRLPIFMFFVLSLLPLQAQDGSPTATSPVHMTVTVRVLGKNKRMPEVNREDIIVRQGKDRLQVTGWTPIGSDRIPLDLFILIDDAARATVSSQFGDLREFIDSLAEDDFGRGWDTCAMAPFKSRRT